MSNNNIEFKTIAFTNIIYNSGNELYMPELNKTYNFRTNDGIRFYPTNILSYWYIIHASNLNPDKSQSELDLIWPCLDNKIQNFMDMISRNDLCIFTISNPNLPVLKPSIYLQGIQRGNI